MGQPHLCLCKGGPAGQVFVRRFFPSGQYETYQWDPNNNLTYKTDRNGNSIIYAYDHQNRLNYKEDPLMVYYNYDPAGRLTQVNDYNSGNRAEYDFSYDNMNRLTSTTTNYEFTSIGAQTVQYGYDAASNRVSMTDPQGTQTTYGYDQLNRLTSLSNSWAGSFGFGYDNLSRRTSLTRPNGVNTSYSYDNLSRLLSVLHQSGSTTLDGATYTYDAAGNRTSKTDLQANITSNYAYDAIYQLLQVTQGTSTTESYTYDLVGNRLSSLGMSPYSYNSSNELTSTPSGSYTYDHNGNTLTDADGRSYTWDIENRLAQVVMPGTGGTVNFKYDPFKRRIQKALTQGPTTTTTNYLYDGPNLIETSDQTGTITTYAATQRWDEPLSHLQSGTTAYFEQDGIGSVTSLSNLGGGIGNSYAYNSFGTVTASTGTLENGLQFAGRDFDVESGLSYYRARYYDPTVGRFLSEDLVQFQAGVNFYKYVRNNPIRFVDPLGASPWDWLDWVSVINWFSCRYYMENCAKEGLTCGLQADQGDQTSLMHSTNTGYADDAKLKLCFARSCPCQKMVQTCGGIPTGFPPIATLPPAVPNYP